VELPSPPNVAEETQSAETPQQGISTTSAAPARQRLRRQALAGGLCAAFLAAAGIAVYYFQTHSSKPSMPSLPSSPQNEALIPDTSFAVENHPFSAKGLSEIVPADVDLYLESIDPEILLPSLVSEEDWAEATKFFDEQVGLSPNEAASFLENEFAIIQEATASAFLSRVRDSDFVEQKISEIEEYNGWGAKLVNGFLVVANSPDLIHKIEEAQKKLTLNLSLTSGFAEARQKLPKTGQVFVYGKKRLDFIPESLKGEAFVIAKKNNGTFVVGL
jgi:hypothetical protein